MKSITFIGIRKTDSFKTGFQGYVFHKYFSMSCVGLWLTLSLGIES